MARKDKKTKTKVGIKDPNTKTVPKGRKPTGKPPKKVKMLISCANQDMAYIKGKVYDVPHQVAVDTARSWIDSGAAEKVE